MDWDRFVLNKLFLAIPELGSDKKFVDQLLAKGIIGQEQYKIFRRVAAGFGVGVKPPRGPALIERIMLTIPEVLSVRGVEALLALDLISSRNAHAMRVAMRAVGRLYPGVIKDATIYERLAMIFDDVFSPETVSFIRALDNQQIEALAEILRKFPQGFGTREAIFGHRAGTLTSGDGALIRAMLEKSIARAQVLRSVISTGRIVRNTVKEAGQLNGVWDGLGLVFDTLFSDKLLKNLVRAGVMSPERYAVWSAVQNLGAGVWRKAVTAAGYNSWAARGLLLSEGIISPETIKMLVALGRITPEQARLLYPVAEIIKGVTRSLGDQWRSARRYRVVVGETPIKTFARSTTQTDKRIIKLLAEAAEDARKNAEKLALTKRFADLSRASQQRLVVKQLHQSMREVWDNVGHLVIFGEKEAAQAAIEAMTFLQKPYGTNSLDLQRSLRYTAQSGVDSYISREESLRALSSAVYRNLDLARGRVDREIAKALLRGQSPAELAQTISKFIRPDVPGGMSYAAMRLARTEINNAFHQTSIRYTREMPWVDGYHWHLSGSHGRPDICNTYATENGGIFDKGRAPAKPHPQCLCYITAESAPNSVFYKRLRSGAYDRYIDQITNRGVFDEDTFTPTRTQNIAYPIVKAAVVAGLGEAARRLREG